MKAAGTDALGVHELGRHGNASGERHQAGERQRTAEPGGEFAQQATGIAGQEPERRDHRQQDRGGGNDGEGHLAGTQVRRQQPRLALLRVAEHVLADDDGVVDQHADGEDKRQQRQDVDGKPQRVE